jgi:hypothetical protein
VDAAAARGDGIDVELNHVPAREKLMQQRTGIAVGS